MLRSGVTIFVGFGFFTLCFLLFYIRGQPQQINVSLLERHSFSPKSDNSITSQIFHYEPINPTLPNVTAEDISEW